MSENNNPQAVQPNKGYKPSDKEKHLYHIQMDRPVFDPGTGAKRGAKPYVQKFTVQDWKNHLEHGQSLGFTTEILWNPEAKKKEQI